MVTVMMKLLLSNQSDMANHHPVCGKRHHLWSVSGCIRIYTRGGLTFFIIKLILHSIQSYTVTSFPLFSHSFVFLQVYPTSLRAVGVGTCSGMARFGAMLTPIIAQVLIRTSVHLATATYGLVAIMAIAAALLLPIETRGRAMT